MSEFIEVKGDIKNFNNATLLIDYMLTFKCNYDCSYCISHDINHPLHKYTVEEISSGLNYVSNSYPNKKIYLTILGGEPFLYKNIFEIIDSLNDNFIFTKIITNLSMPFSFIKKNISKNKSKIKIGASYHTEFADPDEFIEKFSYIVKSNYNITGSIMMHPDNNLFAKGLYVYEKLKGMSIKMHPLWKMGEFNQIYGNEYKYSKYQKEKFDSVKKTNIGLVAHVTYKDKTKDIIPMNTMVANNLDNFKGMKCYAGQEKIHITENGDIYPASCFLRNPSTRLGNIFKRKFRKPISPITCPFLHCRCDTDIQITKQAQN